MYPTIKPIRRIAILGAGAWGTALALHFSRSMDTILWSWEQEHVDFMKEKRENVHFLPGKTLPDTMRITASLDDVKDAEVIIVAVPSAALSSLFKTYRPEKSQPVILASKGFVYSENATTPQLGFEFIESRLGAGYKVGVLSGPSFAQELADGKPTAVTLAFKDVTQAGAIATGLHISPLRIYSSDDRIGVSIGGALKNPLAIATGLSDGMGLGANARAAIVTRGLAEMMRFGVALGAKPETFSGLAGMGDLMLTAVGDLSRNRQVGLKLAEGQSIDDILVSLGHVAEGVGTAKLLRQWSARLNVDMPICTMVARILDKDVTPQDALMQLLARVQKAENGTYHF